MKLIAGIPDGREFPVNLTATPRRLRAGSHVELRFVILDPATGKPARLQVMHEKLFHLFLVSEDLSYFAHEHPERQPDGSFLLPTVLPLSGQYRLLCDIYPEGATPQMIPRSLIVPGAAACACGGRSVPKEGGQSRREPAPRSAEAARGKEDDDVLSSGSR